MFKKAMILTGLFVIMSVIPSCILDLFGGNETYDKGTSAWSVNCTEYRGQNGAQVTYTFPAGGTAFSIWGTDIYTDDSSIGTAAVHAGLITFTAGGTVTIEIYPGQDSYTASTRNGVTSQSYGAWSGSFRFVTQ